MRLLRLSFVFVLLAAPTVRAGVLTSASYTLDLGRFLPPVTFSTTGLVGSGAAHGSSSWWIAAGAAPGGTFTTTLPTTAQPPISGFRFAVTGNSSPGSFAASAGGSMEQAGNLDVRGLGVTLLEVPLLIGSPATVVLPTQQGIGITALAHVWTTKTTSIAGTAPDPRPPHRHGLEWARRRGRHGGAGICIRGAHEHRRLLPRLRLPHPELRRDVGARDAGLAGAGAAALLACGWRKRRAS